MKEDLKKGDRVVFLGENDIPEPISQSWIIDMIEKDNDLISYYDKMKTNSYHHRLNGDGYIDYKYFSLIKI